MEEELQAAIFHAKRYAVHAPNHLENI
jgi:hypothetical protein